MKQLALVTTFLLMHCLSTSAQDLGLVELGLASPGAPASVGDVQLAKSTLPVCTPKAALCNAVYVYVFEGNGSWTDAANWRAEAVPPALLPAGHTIVVRPAAGGQCLLNTAQTIGVGAFFILEPPARLRVINSLTFLK